MIERLVVVAAPSGGGKSVLCRALRSGRLPEVADRLGIDNPSAWASVTRRSLATTDVAELSAGVLFEYNIEAAWGCGCTTGRDEPMDCMLSQAREVSLVTLWTPQRALCLHRLRRGVGAAVASRDGLGLAAMTLAFVVLSCLPGKTAARVARRALPRHAGRGFAPRPIDRHFERLLNAFAHPESLSAMYAWWLSRCGELRDSARHCLVVEADRRVRFHSIETLERMTGLASRRAEVARGKRYVQ